MFEPPPPPRSSLFLRASGAVALTGLLSPVLYSLCLFGYVSAKEGDFDLAAAFPAILVFSFFGLWFAVPSAIVMGLFVEPLKSYQIARLDLAGRLPELLLHVLGSVVGAIILWMLVFSSMGSSVAIGGSGFLLGAYLLGGLCSGLNWWWLVAKPMRLRVAGQN